ncbi:hypothetical protein [Mucilaginibacter celer]|uniref:Uncharacterized protein n=1 Tax=Mucilaginibacter celer TaxID=2305508 RepID=A0A494VVS1_9SPHI|nr:hypothetical protein [Mucilaginibacter celer]AYL97570.1 hypothetical protein HYN43_020745 [Mucilaginibacter celer]
MSTDNKNWKMLEQHPDNELADMINFSAIPQIRSHNPLIKIKQNLLINMAFGLMVCCAYIIIIICFDYWQVRLALGLVMVFSLWALSTAFTQYRSIRTDIFSNGSVLQELKRQRQSIVSWTRSQARMALLIYPVSAAGGFMLGGAIGSGKSVAAFMSKPVVWLLFIIVVAVLVPLCHQLARWMSKRSFGQYLDALKKNIEELEVENNLDLL